MRTRCTKDLSPLVRKETGSGNVFISRYNGSQYDSQGAVLSGPAKIPLRYYELVVASGTVKTPQDTQPGISGQVKTGNDP